VRAGRSLTPPDLTAPPDQRAFLAPSRREVVAVALVALLVVLGGVVAAAVTAGGAAAPSFATDSTIVNSLLLAPGDVPHSSAFGHSLYRPAQIRATPDLVPPASVLEADRSCAFLDGPTDAPDVTALAVNGYATNSDIPFEVVAEAVAYAGAAPVEADEAAVRAGGVVACVRRLLPAVLGDAAQVGGAYVRSARLGPGLGDVVSVAVDASWPATSGPIGAPATDTLELVLLMHARAEVVVLAEEAGGEVPSGVVDRITNRLAHKLDARFP
jgi:hypothetical protein